MKKFSDNLSKKHRTSFKKNLKKMALVEFSKCKNASLVFDELGLDKDSNDKKYASKLIHKWKKEFCDNLIYISTPDWTFDTKLVKYELNFFDLWT